MSLLFGEMFTNFCWSAPPEQHCLSSAALRKSGPNWQIKLKLFVFRNYHDMAPTYFLKLISNCAAYGPFTKTKSHRSAHWSSTLFSTLNALLTSLVSLFQNPTHSRFNSKFITYTKLCKIFPHPNLQLGLISWTPNYHRCTGNRVHGI